MGSSPGLMTAIRQLELAPAMNPLCNAGIRPERTSDDLPLPEVPTTARKRVLRSRRRRSSISFSRPKNRCSSSASNGRSPGNGLNRAAFLQLRDEGPQAGEVDPVPLRDDDGFVRTEAILLGRVRSDLRDADQRQLLRPAVTGT